MTEIYFFKILIISLNRILDFILNSGFITGIIGVVVGYYVANKRHVFQRLYDKKLVLITNLYKQIVRLEFEIKRYTHFEGANSKTDQKKIDSLNKIKDNFQSFQHKFWEIEIVLDNSSVNLINKFLNKYIEITSKLSLSNISYQLRDGKAGFESWDECFKLISSDLVSIKNELKKDFKQVLRKTN